MLPSITFPKDPTIKNDAFFTMNLRVSKSFLKYFEAYLAINNIFDRNYESEFGYPSPGRSFYGGISAKY
jgi:outer membrane cobalamin receptor